SLETFPNPLEQLRGVPVQLLDLVVKRRILPRHGSGRAGLLVEGRARHGLQHLEREAAFGKRGEKEDRDEVREPEHVLHELVVLLQWNARDRECGLTEQSGHLVRGRGIPAIAHRENAARQRAHIRSEERMDARDTKALISGAAKKIQDVTL